MLEKSLVKNTDHHMDITRPNIRIRMRVSLPWLKNQLDKCICAGNQKNARRVMNG